MNYTRLPRARRCSVRIMGDQNSHAMSAVPRCGWLVLLAVIVCVMAEDEKYRVVVQQGALQGHGLTTRRGREFVGFHAIPYAKPPVGDLRFKSPQAPEPWSGVRDATRDSAICLQRDLLHDVDGPVEGSEDCLYLNVYTPQIEKSNKKSKGLDVMFWIHGGGWFQGTGNLYGPTYLLDKDVVLVTINYRLGPLGFLSTGDEAAPGNFGLKDQVAALRWVRDNIAAFGGNPDSVTIFGESAGGASVQHHMLSPMSEGLFHRAISESGSSLCPWAFHFGGNSRSQAVKLAELLNCPTDCNVGLVKCLREKDAVDLLKAEVHLKGWDLDPLITFRPVLELSLPEGEEAFFPEMPEDILKDTSKVRQIPWMTGIVSEEGILHVGRYFNKGNLLQELDQDFNRVVPISLYYGESAPDVDNVSKQLRKFYFGDRPIDRYTRQELIELYGDSFFLPGLHQSLKLQTAGSKAPVYLYYFTYRGSNSFSTYLGAPSTEDYGVSHEDELQYLFTKETLFPGSKLTEDDEKMVDVMTTLWTNFARTGNPTPEEGEDGDVGLTWDPTSFKNLEYLNIGSEFYMDQDLLKDRAQFWASLPLKHKTDKGKDEL